MKNIYDTGYINRHIHDHQQGEVEEGMKISGKSGV